jgi:hypothetical protein
MPIKDGPASRRRIDGPRRIDRLSVTEGVSRTGGRGWGRGIQAIPDGLRRGERNA